MRKFSEKDYVAFGQAILRGEALPQDLRKDFVDLTNKLQNLLLKLRKYDPTLIFAWLVFPLSMWYQALEDLREGRLSVDSPQIKAANQMKNAILSVFIPRIAISLAIGDVTSLRRLAAVMEAARNLPGVVDLEKMDRWIVGLFQELGLNKKKLHKKTRHLRALLPLWLLGFGSLPYVEKTQILQQLGLGETDIPEDDTLRKFLSYYKVSTLNNILEKVKTAF